MFIIFVCYTSGTAYLEAYALIQAVAPLMYCFPFIVPLTARPVITEYDNIKCKNMPS